MSSDRLVSVFFNDCAGSLSGVEREDDAARAGERGYAATRTVERGG